MGLNQTYWKKVDSKEGGFWWEHKAKDLPVRKNANNYKYVRRASKGGDNKYFQASTFELWLDRAGIVFDRYGVPTYSDGSFLKEDLKETFKNDYIKETGIISEVDFLKSINDLPMLEKLYPAIKELIENRLDLISASKKRLEIEERSVNYNPATLPDWTRKYNLLETLVDQGSSNLGELTESKSYTAFGAEQSILKSQLRFVRGWGHVTRKESDRLVNELEADGFILTEKIPHPKSKGQWTSLININPEVTMWVEPIYLPEQDPKEVKWDDYNVYHNPYRHINPYRLYQVYIDKEVKLPSYEQWTNLKKYGENYKNHTKSVERITTGVLPEFKVKQYNENRKHQLYKKRKKLQLQNYIQTKHKNSNKQVKELVQFRDILKKIIMFKVGEGEAV